MGVLSPSSPPREGSTVSARRGAGGGASHKSDRSERLPPGHHHAHHHHQKPHLSGRSTMAAAGPGPSSVSPPLSISSGLLLRHVPLLVSVALFSWSLSVYLTRVGHPWLFSSSSSSSSSLVSSRSALADDCQPLIASSNSSSLLLQSSGEREGAFPGQGALTMVSGGDGGGSGGGGGGGSVATEQERAQQLPHLTGAARLAGVMHQLEAMIGEPHAPPPHAAGGDARRRGALELPTAGAAATATSSAAESGVLVARQQQQPQGPLLSIFCAPKPYGSPDDPSDPQRRALLSWLRLSPPARVILLGNDQSFHALAREFPGRISVEPDVDTNFYGVPLFHSMLARAQAADTPLSMIINGDIILLADLMPVVAKVRAAFEHWVLTAARWDVGADFPFVFEKPPPLEPSGGGFNRGAGGGAAAAAWDAKVRTHVRAHGSLHTYGGVDFWMWNSDSPAPLFRGAMPPFSFGRGKYDNWLTHEVVAAGLRQMVDASEAVTSVHVAHSYAHVADAGGGADGKAAQKSFWSTRKQTSWELYANIHLAQTHGSYSNQKGTGLHVPWRIVTCDEAPAGNVCMQRRLRPANCSCEYSPYVRASQSDPRVMESNRVAHWLCGTVSVDETRDFAIDPVPNRRSKPGLPHTMEQILPQVAREVGGERVVTLVAVTFGYAEMLMSFACRLRALGLADNLVVAALDEDLYRFAFTQGLAVYYERVSTSLRGLDSKNCAFGSTCFRQFTKLKSRAVLRVLQAGYSVLWTDVDIVWYADPLPDLMAFGPGTFPIQSNEPNASLPGTGIRRINSGFYFARADKKTVAAFEAITAHAAKTKLSEQPSFYDVLCGVKGEYLAKEPGREECVWKRNGLRTVFLDRSKYPNGAVHGFWEARDVSGACRAAGCLILHNNWISGKDEKRRRMVDNGYWHYDAERRMCIWPWHSRLPPVVHARTSQ